MNEKPYLSSLDKNYSAIFVLIITVSLLIVMILSAKQNFADIEKSFYPKDFLIENFNRLRMKIGDRVFPQVLIGKDGWMEYTGGKSLDDFQNTAPFTDSELALIANNLKACYQYAHEQNFTFLVVVAPNKASIYPDKLPEQIQPLSSQSKLDQITKYLRERNIPAFLDLRSALKEARQQQNVYLKADTHWNGYGAYIGYREIINTLAKNHPELKVYPIEFFQIREKLGQNLDLANMLKANFIHEPWFAPKARIDFVNQIDIHGPYGYHQISWIPGKNLPSLLMLHDSFGSRHLNHYLMTNFSKANYIFLDLDGPYFNRESIAQFKPDVMVLEIVERSLNALVRLLSGCNPQ